MSERDGSSFPPTPVTPGGGRRPWLVMGLVCVVVAGSFAVAQVTPGPDPDPSRATEPPRPTQTVVPAEPIATALPRFAWYSAPEAPIDDLFVEAGSVRRLRLTSARLMDDALAQPGRDLLLRGTRGETVCLCWQPSGTESGDARALDLVRRDGDAREVSRTTVAVVNGLDVGGTPNGPLQVALEPSPDGRFAYLARSVRASTGWQVSLDVIDLASATITDTVDLIPVPLDDRSAVVAVERPTLRIAPDGRHALMLSGVQRRAVSGSVTSARRAWIIGLDGTSLGPVVVADTIADEPGEGSVGACSWIAFASPAIVAKGCRNPAGDVGATPLELRRYDLAGRDMGAVLVGGEQRDPEQVLLDVTGGLAYGWDPVRHSLFAADLVAGGWRSARPPSGDRDVPEAVVLSGDRPPSGARTTWSGGRSATDPAPARTLVGSPDGRMLFAVGAGSRPGSSSGIWVFDTRTLQLLERWPALASYESLALFEDGRWLAAVGRPGVTATGGPADWGTSVTVHDTVTGRPVLQIGDLGTDGVLAFPWPGPVAASP